MLFLLFTIAVSIVLLLTAPQVHYQSIRQKSSSTVTTWFQRFRGPTVVCIVIILLYLSSTLYQDVSPTSHYLIKARRCSWTWSSLPYWQLCLLNIPHFLACFQMDLETLGSILSPANIAQQGSRLNHLLLLLLIFMFSLFNPSSHTWLAPFQMLFQTVRQKSPGTPRAWNQGLLIVIIECSFIDVLNVGL